MSGPVGLSSANLGVLAAQYMIAYMQAQIAGAAGGVGGASPTMQGSESCRAVNRTLCFLQATLTRAYLDTVAFKHTQLM